jgi:hypothetical protein
MAVLDVSCEHVAQVSLAEWDQATQAFVSH